MPKVSKKDLENRPKEKYKLKNWSTYNKSLVQRGDFTIWMGDDFEQSWCYSGANKPGGTVTYSDTAIEFCLIIRHLYNLTYRATEGFVNALFRVQGIELDVPSYSQVQKRSGKIEVDIRVRKSKKNQGINVVIDSTGLKVFGEGEWKMRKHGKTKRRTWRKVHMASDGEDLEILAVSLTSNSVDDAEAGIELIEEIKDNKEKIKSVSGDGAYDKVKFRGCLDKQIDQRIPPQHNAVDSEGKVGAYHQRDEQVKAIAKMGRSEWKKEIDYHIRSKSEVNMYRYKKIFSGELKARKEKFEENEIKIKCKILNKFVGIGMPDSYKVAS